MVVVRPAETADAQAVYDVTRASVEGLAAEYYSDDVIESWLDGRTVESCREACASGAVSVAEVAGDVVGYVQAKPGEIKRLFIRPDYAGRGLGRQLMRAALKAAGADGQRRIRIEATLNAVAFYQRFGFHIVTSAMSGMAQRPGYADIPMVRLEGTPELAAKPLY